MPSLAKSWRIFTTHVQPGRLLQEDAGVKAGLWFGRKPDSPLHGLANFLRLFFAIVLAPIFVFIPAKGDSVKELAKRILWGIEWARTPDAVLLESPGSLASEKNKLKVGSRGQYAVTSNKPKWLLEVGFRGTEIVSLEQVRYEWERKRQKGGPKKSRHSPDVKESLQRRVESSGYTAISYAMKSAEKLFSELGRQHDTQPHGEQRKDRLRKRRNVARALLDEYARARGKLDGTKDGTEFIWLDEYCLSDPKDEDNEEETKKQRDKELGQLTDIFRGARRVVVFCHVEDCHHTDNDCPWVNRLFTLGEILHASKVLRMTRTEDDITKSLVSRITVIAGQQFRSDMQACAEEDKMWHLYNIMQHATNSGAVSWQSAIHSLVVEAIRRDEADGFDAHKYLGKALNGLLPRRSQLEDLQGVNGWADLAWLLELNQGYYNAALLAAVCKLADSDVKDYNWWGKPIAPREGSERLEPLVTAIPTKYGTFGNGPTEPILSIIGPKSVALTHWLERDSGAFSHRREMKSLRWCTFWISFIFVVLGIIVGVTAASVGGAIALIWIGFIIYAMMTLLAGTMFVKKTAWIVFEDHSIGGRDPMQWLRSQDPSFVNASEWGPRQLIPQWDTPHPTPSPRGSPPRPYAATLVDLRTGVLTKAAITSKPNGMVVLAVHGSGITCMLLDRDVMAGFVDNPTTAVKVGMVNLPPFVLAQSEESGTVYVGTGVKREPVSSTKAVYHRTEESSRDDVEKFGESPNSPSLPGKHHHHS